VPLPPPADHPSGTGHALRPRGADAARCPDHAICPLPSRGARLRSRPAADPRVPDPVATTSETELRAVVERALAQAYELDREIGRGGMGIVYRARDRRLKRFVAIKILPPELAFRSDIRRASSRGGDGRPAHHPHIVPIYAVDEADGAGVLRHGVRRRRQPRQAHPRPRPAAHPRGAAHPGRGGRRARLRPRARRGAPRHQARQHPPRHRRGPGAGHRLRHRPGDHRGERRAADGHGMAIGTPPT
jgi:hypothetical protein